MKLNNIFTVILGITLIIITEANIHDEIVKESENEVVYRVTRGVHGGKKRGECRYKKGTWDECNPTTNTQQRTLTLKRGDDSCEQSKLLTRKCKKACRYEKGEWNPCNFASNTRVRSDKLKSGGDSCEAQRVVTKKCKKICRYDRQAEWGPCDPSTGQKTKVMRLLSGMPSECESTKVVNKPCQGRRGGKHTDDDDYEDK